MKIKYSITEFDKIYVRVAKDLNDGKIVAWFQGGSEFGPRALGFRSILADAGNPDIKNIINETSSKTHLLSGSIDDGKIHINTTYNYLEKSIELDDKIQNKMRK